LKRKKTLLKKIKHRLKKICAKKNPQKHSAKRIYATKKKNRLKKNCATKKFRRNILQKRNLCKKKAPFEKEFMQQRKKSLKKKSNIV
jgi:hypothetical protein